MLEQPNVRRHHDGSINIDAYRQVALAERRLAIAIFARSVAKTRGGLAAAVVLAAGLYVASHSGTGSEASAAARHNGAMLPL
jgi:hypothetical protein